jgi:hypothetical protein
MSLLDAIIIYLSAGAPFGVLVLFSQKSATARITVMNAFLAIFVWPISGTYRLYRGLFGHLRSNSDGGPLEVLQQLSQEIPTNVAELFDIAGHSNPWVATNCYARARKRVIQSHIDRLSKFPVDSQVPSLLSDEATAPRQIVITVRT